MDANAEDEDGADGGAAAAESDADAPAAEEAEADDRATADDPAAVETAADGAGVDAENEEPDDTESNDREAEAASELPVSVDVEIEAGRSVVEVTGDRDAAVVVRSARGERIYLPPEDFERPPASRGRASGGDARGQRRREDAYGTGPKPSDSPYQSSSDSPYQSPFRRDSPYQSPDESDSPYQRGGPVDERQGLEPTPDGFRIVHPEPITDLRLLR